MLPSLALYQPDQPGNCGTLIRLSVCLGFKIHIIHPCGFLFSHEKLRRSGMDYLDHADITEHNDYITFIKSTPDNRKILLTTKGSTSYTSFTFHQNDILLLGRESAGVPETVHVNADARLIIPMKEGVAMRSINMAISGAMVMGEALKQVKHI